VSRAGRVSRVSVARGRRRARLVGALLALPVLLGSVVGLVGLVGFAGPAAALPPDGAGADTPGTSASVSPTSLAPGATISFTLSGFPGGETVYVKIDDGVGYGDTAIQGSGVVHQQAIPASGTVRGSFTVPAGITAGAHWLRFLASAELTDANGGYLGVEGYTHRGGTDFTVVLPAGSTGAAGTSGGSVAAGTTTGGTAAGTTAGTTAGGATSVTGQGAVVQVQPAAPEATAPAEQATAEPSASASASAAASAEPRDTATADAAVADAGSDAGAPVVGIVVGGVLALAGVAFVTVTAVQRRRAAVPASDPR
jgi:hypothetical protein